MHEDQRFRSAIGFEVDEVPERLLVKMQAVDKGCPEGLVAEERRWSLTRKEGVAGFGEDMRLGEEGTSDIRLWVDADGDAGRRHRAKVSPSNTPTSMTVDGISAA